MEVAVHHRDTEGTEEARRFEISNLRLLESLCPLCVLCVSVVNLNPIASQVPNMTNYLHLSQVGGFVRT
jgi:hypothetical protein